MWEWAKSNRLFAVIIVAFGIVVLGSVADGVSMRQTAQGYLNAAKGWAAAYQRDTAATKTAYEARIKVLTADRDAYRAKYVAAKGRMSAPWVPPKNPGEIEERFLKMGYRGAIR
ncbi:hypothetical protein M0Q28_05805 [Patescibacteria group bacterium]|jgi:hypothetical protein|nr:hypothetical protein [Patescibacteria group bacterium]